MLKSIQLNNKNRKLGKTKIGSIGKTNIRAFLDSTSKPMSLKNSQRFFIKICTDIFFRLEPKKCLRTV